MPSTLTPQQKIASLTLAAQAAGQHDITGLVAKLDEITSAHTAFTTFLSLLNAAGGYRPSIRVAPKGIYHALPYGVRIEPTIDRMQAELDFLAMAYDMAQEARNDPRRAFRV